MCKAHSSGTDIAAYKVELCHYIIIMNAFEYEIESNARVTSLVLSGTQMLVLAQVVFVQYYCIASYHSILFLFGFLFRNLEFT